MADDEDLDDELWGKLGGPPAGDPEPDAEVEVEVGPPIRVTFVVRSEKVPIAPWAQGWRVGSMGPDKGQVMLVCENDMDVSPVAQLSAITGLLGTVKSAQLDIVWWAIQSRGPIVVEDGAEPGAVQDLDAEFSDLLDGTAGEPPAEG